jgi:hypothetical protein
LDWLITLAFPKTRARRVGFLHGVGNVVMVTLFVLSWISD